MSRAPAIYVFTILGFLLLTVPAILSGRGGTSEAGDQDRHHLVTIDVMASQWPRVDLVNYESATAPGYHLFMAGVSNLGAGPLTLRLLNCLVSLGLVIMLVRLATRVASPVLSVVLVAPVILSPYLLGAAIWLTTDNAALLCVLLVIGGASLRGPPTTGRLLRWGLYTTIAVAIRQIHLWPLAAIGLSGLLASPLAGRVPAEAGASGASGTSGEPARGSWRPLLVAVIAALPPLALVGLMLWSWNGLTPPGYRAQHDAGMNPATFAYALGLAAAYGVFFLPAAWPQVRKLRVSDRGVWLVASIAVVLALVVPTSYDKQAGRYGGWFWKLIEVMPTVADRSLVLVPAAVVGAVTVLLLTRAVVARGQGRSALVLLVTLAGFVSAQSVNSQCFQRYFELLFLSGLAWMAAMAATSPMTPRRWWLGPLALAGCESALSVITLYWPMLTSG